MHEKKRKSSLRLNESSLQYFEKFISFEINIIDNGGGISPEGVKNLFMNFGKLKENQEQNKGGTGLGLSICKQIVESMGGSVVCTSEIGVGTQFKIKLNTK